MDMSSLSHCLSVRGMSVTWELVLCLCSWMGHIALWSPVVPVYGDIALSINTMTFKREKIIHMTN